MSREDIQSIDFTGVEAFIIFKKGEEVIGRKLLTSDQIKSLMIDAINNSQSGEKTNRDKITSEKVVPSAVKSPHIYMMETAEGAVQDAWGSFLRWMLPTGNFEPVERMGGGVRG